MPLRNEKQDKNYPNFSFLVVIWESLKYDCEFTQKCDSIIEKVFLSCLVLLIFS